MKTRILPSLWLKWKWDVMDFERELQRKEILAMIENSKAKVVPSPDAKELSNE